MRAKIQQFTTNEAGAIMVDSVVLTAAIVGLGITSMLAVRTGTVHVGTEVERALGSAQVAMLDIMGT